MRAMLLWLALTFLENVNTNMHLITWPQPRKDIYTALYLKRVHYIALQERSEQLNVLHRHLCCAIQLSPISAGRKNIKLKGSRKKFD